MAFNNINKFLAETLNPFLATRLVTSAIPKSVLIDLNDFMASPYVTISPTGNSAIMAQNSLSAFVFLEHNPVLDPAKIIPRAGLSLEFDFNFVKAPRKDDEFGVFLLDQFGVPIGLLFEFFARDSGKGTISFDLSSLSPDPVGLVFVLSEIDPVGDLQDSTVKITNVRLVIDSYPTPDPPRLTRRILAN
jgi:hypothetical protein